MFKFTETVNLPIYFCIINVLFFELLVVAQAADDVADSEESENKIYKRDLSYYQNYQPHVAYGSYPTTSSVYPSYAPAPTYVALPQPYNYPTSYCAPEERSTQPPECDILDQPLGGTSTSKNCTCTYTNSPPGCTLRMCTTADTCIIPCTRFSCICNGPTASPNYCVKVLPYPTRAVVPYTPTPAAGSSWDWATVNGVTHAHTHLNGVNTLQSQAFLVEANRLAEEQQTLKALALANPQASSLQTLGLIQSIASL
ncbi:unnamed protein product [Orchesella dallaii]|uniref:Uncharacterized protein n=1 Tax=Orchesella dallaii TaxID=48710 RepID=A0ABP1R1N3_9HEXA